MVSGQKKAIVQVQWNLIDSAVRWYFVLYAPVFTYSHDMKKIRAT